MRVRLDQKFVDPNDKFIPREPGKDDVLTLRDVMKMCLFADFKDDQGLSGEEKFERYRLGVKIKDAGDEVELSLEELVKIKELIGKMFSVIVSGQAWEMLEGKK